MEKGFSAQAGEEICKLLGEAVFQILAEDRPVTNETITEMVQLLSDDESALAEDFALSLLRR